jgi:hypothetical protein
MELEGSLQYPKIPPVAHIVCHTNSVDTITLYYSYFKIHTYISLKLSNTFRTHISSMYVYIPYCIVTI